MHVYWPPNVHFMFSLGSSAIRGFVFFFSSRRRHTRLQGDWSSDVCSSDLHDKHTFKWGAEARFNRDTGIAGINGNGSYTFGGGPAYAQTEIRSLSGQHDIQIGRASCRERV